MNAIDPESVRQPISASNADLSVSRFDAVSLSDMCARTSNSDASVHRADAPRRCKVVSTLVERVMATEPDNLVLQLLREIRAKVDTLETAVKDLQLVVIELRRDFIDLKDSNASLGGYIIQQSTHRTGWIEN